MATTSETFDNRMSSDEIQRTAALLRAGGVLLLPTDTVYGLAQSVRANPKGPRRLFEIKHRVPTKTIAWLIADTSDLGYWSVNIPDYAYALARAFWPGGLTLVFSASPEVPGEYQSAAGTIALRVPASDDIRELIRICGSPLATTSANTSGSPAPSCMDDLEPCIVQQADIVWRDPKAGSGYASTVVDCTGPKPLIVREGAISASMIDSVLR